MADLREVFRFRGCFRVEFCYWNTPGGNQGAEHGCWVHDGGGAHLQVNREPMKTCGKCLIEKKRTAWYAFENPPQGKGHRLPSLFPLWSGCESPGFLQKIPCWASADRCNRSCHTLTAAGKTARRYQITSFLNKLRPFQKWFYNSPYSCSQCNLFWRCCGSMWTFPLTLTYWSFSGWKSESKFCSKRKPEGSKHTSATTRTESVWPTHSSDLNLPFNILGNIIHLWGFSGETPAKNSFWFNE